MNSMDADNYEPSPFAPSMQAAEPAYDVILIGAGAAGLAAAADLSAAGSKVLLLDARDRIGGRIDTRREPGWLLPIERGAEFVHGVPEETWGLIRANRVVAVDINTSDLMWTGDKFEAGEDFWGDSQALIARLDRVTGEDQSFQAFLEQHAADLPARAKEAASAYVEGFNAADRNIISAQSLARAELASDEIEGDRLFRILDGYDALMTALWQTAAAHGATLRLSSPVTAVDWSRGEVRVASTNENGVSRVDHASKAIITLPVGVLQAEPPAVGAVRFSPALHAKRHALASLRSGAVVKAMLRFKSAFWESHVSFDLSFFHALGQPFPTWWTSLPVRDTVLTGWSGGPAAEQLAKLSDAEVLERAVDTLAELFKLDRAAILCELEASQICNWQVDPLARGAYSYVAVGGLAAPAELAAPLEDTLFFAGEATHTGVSGTVDGAIASGRRVAREIRELSTKDEVRRTKD